MRIFTLALLCMLCAKQVPAQADTSYIYYDNDGAFCTKAFAAEVSKSFRQGDAWKREVYNAVTNRLKSKGCYKDKQLSEPVGVHISFDEKGFLKDSSTYERDRLEEIYFFYQSHQRKGYARFDSVGNSLVQQGWDEQGNEIPNYIAYRAPRFKEGPEDWVKYLKRKLGKNQPDMPAVVKDKNVVVAFTVMVDGRVNKVSIHKKSGFVPLDIHASSAIENSPNWVPGVVCNEIKERTLFQSVSYAY